MKDLEQLKQLILADLEKESKQRIEVATKEQEERINQMNAQYSQQEMAKKTALKQEAKSQYEKEQQTILNASKKKKSCASNVNFLRVYLRTFYK